MTLSPTSRSGRDVALQISIISTPPLYLPNYKKPLRPPHLTNFFFLKTKIEQTLKRKKTERRWIEKVTCHGWETWQRIIEEKKHSEYSMEMIGMSETGRTMMGGVLRAGSKTTIDWGSSSYDQLSKKITFLNWDWDYWICRFQKSSFNILDFSPRFN